MCRGRRRAGSRGKEVKTGEIGELLKTEDSRGGGKQSQLEIPGEVGAMRQCFHGFPCVCVFS